MTADVILDRIASVCAGTPFEFHQAVTPFSFDLQPSGQVDRVFRLEYGDGPILGGFNFAEERNDRVTIWVARKYNGDAPAAYKALVTDATSLRASIIRDGIVDSGEYFVPDDGNAQQIVRQPNAEFAVLRLQLPVNYEVTI